MAEEKNFETKVKAFLTENNCWYVKFFANAMTRKGVPDILACVNGHFVGIEVKAEKGIVSELQKYNIEKIKKANGIALILRPSNFDEFKLLIKELKK